MQVKSRFIVVEHHADKAGLHFDLRFEKPNQKIWISFAVRKGIPTEPGKRHLAVRTHDHTEKEALFLGRIKEGYGKGLLKKWDDGYCIIHKYKPGHMLVEFKGRKIKGFYHFINSGVVSRQKYKSQQYMLFKAKNL
jgi:bifunctional non-homologous end joining protein LigD